MPRLIDADALYQSFGASGNCSNCPHDWYKCQYYNEHTLMEFCERIDDAPTVDAEPTEEQVKEYCRKRCLVIVTSELFNEMKARWSAEPVRYGRWIDLPGGKVYCTECGEQFEWRTNCCPECGAKMDGGGEKDGEIH